MSLYGSLQIGGNTLHAMQIGLQVVGNNIANSNTPGFVRERAVFTPAPVQRIGNLTLGLGVEVAGIVQSVDRFAEERLRDAGGDRASADIQEKAYRELEGILGELTDSDVSSLMAGFFNSVDEVLNQPEAISIRSLAVQAGKTLTTSINTLDRRVSAVYEDYSKQVSGLSSEINTLSEEIRKLNLQIVTLEGGSLGNEAGGLRSARQAALKRLGEIMTIKVTETEAGATNVSVGGEFLVFEGTRQEVQTVYSSTEGLQTASIEFIHNGSELRVGGGELHGLVEARDNIAGKFLDRLDEFAQALTFEFNKVYSQGQGITGFGDVLSLEAVDDASASLDAAGLPFAPTSGQFQVLVYNRKTNLTQTSDVVIDLNGLDGDTSLASLATTLNGIDGVTARVNADNRLEIEAESTETELAFSGDTSGVLAALGINTFFTGSSAGDIDVNQTLLDDASKFAAASDGVGVGVDNARRLVSLHDERIDDLNGGSISGVYDQLLNETTQGSTVASAVADGLRTFEATLDAAAQGVSGVNLDEEAIDMIMLQRTYQAAARYIGTLSDLLDVLVNL
ncbi:MAG: flagellar hook-associated protein FlgK [Planctomycetales bacterium]|nr:flagellar hook-associated protein FlgK [Planctomycetales bacterium]